MAKTITYKGGKISAASNGKFFVLAANGSRTITGNLTDAKRFVASGGKNKRVKKNPGKQLYASYAIHNGHYFGVYKEKIYGPYNTLDELQNRIGGDYALKKIAINKFKKYYVDNPQLWKHRPVFYSSKKDRLGARSIRAKLNPGKNEAGDFYDKMTPGATELYLYAENDGDLYRQQRKPIEKNLVAKFARGIYDRQKAIKLYMYLVDNAAKKYTKEFSGVWNEIFPRDERLEAAKMFVLSWEAENSLGNYDSYLPKKYQKKPINNPASRHRTPEQMYKDFTQRTNVKTVKMDINLPGPKDKLIFVGKGIELSYGSDKWDGIFRLYKHELKKHGVILALPNKNGFINTFLLVGVKVNMKKVGLTG